MAGTTEYNCRQLGNKSKIQTIPKTTKKCALLLPAEAYLLIEDQPVTRAYQDEINSALSLPDLCDHMIKKYLLHTTTPDTINWELGGHIYVQMDKYAQRFVTRYIYQHLLLHGSSFQQHPTILCPICKKNKETFEHFNLCSKN